MEISIERACDMLNGMSAEHRIKRDDILVFICIVSGR